MYYNSQLNCINNGNNDNNEGVLRKWVYMKYLEYGKIVACPKAKRELRETTTFFKEHFITKEVMYFNLY